MRPRFSTQRQAAMTLFEVGVVVAVVMILAVLLLPFTTEIGGKVKARQINCINNLREICLASKIWAGDNNDTFPMGISVAKGGSMEMIATGNVLSTFLVMSNELSVPQILYCAADEGRFRTSNFAGLSNSNISYFVSADMTNNSNPRMIFAGDSDLMLGGKMLNSGLVSFWTNNLASWSETRHPKSGNIALADGSVDSTTSARLQTHLQQTGLATNHFTLP